MKSTGSAEACEKVLRRFEREVLDVRHLSLPLMKRPAGKALYAVMAAYDSMLLPILEVSSQIEETAIGSRYGIKSIVDSVTYALRWVTDGKAPTDPEPAPDVKLIDDGGQFLIHARDYFQVAISHIMYSRGLISVECDEESRVVRFVPLPGGAFPHGFAAAVIGQLAGRKGDDRRAEVLEAARRRIPRLSYRLDKGRIRLTSARELASVEVSDLADLFTTPEVIEVPGEADLVGFTMDEFRRFWHGLHSWSIAATELYIHLISRGVPQERCMPTQVVLRSEFPEWMSIITGLDAETIGRIAARLTYQVADERRDMILQPLICGPASVSWCPLAIKQARPERNMLKLMSRLAPLRDRAATLIGNREDELLRQLGMLLAKRGGYDFKLNSVLRDHDRQAELDLLAYNRKAPTEVLLVEAKAVLAVDEVGEVQAATEQFKAAQNQLKRAIEILTLLSNDRKRSLYPFVDWEQVRTYRPLVVAPDSNPLADFDHSEIPLITLELIRTQLRSRHLKTPTTIWEASRLKEWLKPLPIHGEDLYSSITIGSVRYEFPTRGGRFDT